MPLDPVSRGARACATDLGCKVLVLEVRERAALGGSGLGGSDDGGSDLLDGRLDGGDGGRSFLDGGDGSLDGCDGGGLDGGGDGSRHCGRQQREERESRGQ